MVSLTGKNYKIKKDKTIRMPGNKDFKCRILSSDIAYSDQKSTFKRMLMSNSLDSRFYSTDINSDVLSVDQNRMRDPQEIIVFFKQEIM